MSGPLDGVRVVDLSRILAGPYCTMLLGDLGADIVKIELPGVGDETRRWGPPFAEGESAYFLAVNRNKRSVTIDLRSEGGREVLRRLLATADVVIDNFRPGTLEEFGFGREEVLAAWPRIIGCSISAFGVSGPFRERPGFDFAIQAMGGIMSVTGPEEGPPSKVAVAIVDITAGLYAGMAILAALHARGRDDRGQWIDVSLFGSQLAWLANLGSAYLLTGREPQRLGNAHPSIAPYELFPAADGHIAIAVGTDAQFRALAQVFALPDLAADPRFQTNAGRVAHRGALRAALEAVTCVRSAAEILDLLTAAGVPCAPLLTVGQALTSEAARALGSVIEMAHPTVGTLPQVRWPFDLSGTPASARRPPPLLGEHTTEVLADLGYDAEEIARLRADGAI